MLHPIPSRRALTWRPGDTDVDPVHKVRSPIYATRGPDPIYTILVMAFLWALPLVVPLAVCIAVIVSPLIFGGCVCFHAIQVYAVPRKGLG
jgi:hypothetical protein